MKKITPVRRPLTRWTTQPASQDLQESVSRRSWSARSACSPNKKAWKGSVRP